MDKNYHLFPGKPFRLKYGACIGKIHPIVIFYSTLFRVVVSGFAFLLMGCTRGYLNLKPFEPIKTALIFDAFNLGHYRVYTNMGDENCKIFQ